MERQSVNSTAIRSIGHDGQHMEVEYASGGVYHYADVPVDVFDKVRNADSVGKALRTHVLEGNFAVKKVGDVKVEKA